MGELIEFPSNGTNAQGWLAEPPGGDSGAPALIVIQEWWGLVPQIKDVCERLAGEGFAALAPDLYNGASTREPDEAAKKMMALSMKDAALAMGGAISEITRRTGSNQVGVIGFCMGGGLALLLACQRPGEVAAVAPFYGVIPWQDGQPDYTKMKAKVRGHFAENDSSASPEVAAELVRNWRNLGLDAEIEIHPGVDHAFFNDTRPEVYSEEESRKAWASTVEFFHSVLG